MRFFSVVGLLKESRLQGGIPSPGIAHAQAIEANSHYASNKIARSFASSKVLMKDSASVPLMLKNG